MKRLAATAFLGVFSIVVWTTTSVAPILAQSPELSQLEVASDQFGSLNAPQAAQTGPDGKGGGAGVQKFAFKGFSSVTGI